VFPVHVVHFHKRVVKRIHCFVIVPPLSDCVAADVAGIKVDRLLLCAVALVKSYQNFACSANIPGIRANHEYALHLLQTCNGHIKVSLYTFHVLCVMRRNW